MSEDSWCGWLKAVMCVENMVGDVIYKEAAILCLSLMCFAWCKVGWREKKPGKRAGSKFEVAREIRSESPPKGACSKRIKRLRARSQKSIKIDRVK